MADLGASWGFNWRLNPEEFNSSYSYVPMVWSSNYSVTKVLSITLEHPGSYWLIWNEPDYWRQANLSPQRAAQQYHTLRPLILSHDPQARLIVGGLFFPAGYWARDFRDAYRLMYGEYPIVEGWHIHVYPAAYGVDSWRRTISDFARWVDSTGAGLELWVTEFGHLSSDEAAAQVMQDQIAWLEAQPAVTRYAWYATRSDDPLSCPGCKGALLNADGSRTWLGDLYRRLP